MSFKYIEVRELHLFVQVDGKNNEQDMVMIQSADNHVFSVLASYIKQEAGPLLSPYGGCELVFWDEEENKYKRNNGDIADHREIEFVFTDRTEKLETLTTSQT